MMDYVTISATGSDQIDDMVALAAWFDEEPELRGLVKAVPVEPAEGELGSWAGVLTAAVGTGGFVTVLAGSLKIYFSQPRGAKVHLTVTRADGTDVHLEADGVKRASVSELVQLLLPADADEQ